MCGRFVNLNKVDKISKIFEIDKIENFQNILSFNIAPTQSTIIITHTKSLKIEKGHWGFSFYDKKHNLKKNIINSRLETIQEKIIFKESFEKKRCVIPANGYYEWSKKNNIKIPYFINIPYKENIYFAGIWKYLDFKKDTSKVFSIITKPANNLLKEIHHRMPIILSSIESKDYLDHNNYDYFKKNINSNIEEYLEFYEVSKFVNNPSNNSKDCIRPIKYL